LKTVSFGIISLVIGCGLFVGCSSKKYYEPKKSVDSKFKIFDLKQPILDKTSIGATLKDFSYISKDGVKTKIKNNYKFLNSSNNTEIFANTSDKVLIKTHTDTQIIQFKVAIVGATLKDNILATIGTDNSLALYDIKSKQFILKEYRKASVLNDIKIANPIFLNTLVLYPTLDGKIVIVDKIKKKIIKTINLDPNNTINNIIFLTTLEDDGLVAATSKKLFSFIDGKVNIKDIDIKDIVVDDNFIYLTTLDGEVRKYDKTLKKIASKKFKFAKFYTIAVGKKIYLLESQDYLIQLDKNLTNSVIYDFSFDEDKKVISIKNKIYFDNNYIVLP